MNLMILLSELPDDQLPIIILDQTASDPSMNNETNSNYPFNIRDTGTGTSAEIVKNPNYIPKQDQQINFDLLLQVTDKANHATNQTVKIVIMTGNNNVSFGFDNKLDDIENNQNAIFDTFHKVFNWSFSPEGKPKGQGQSSRAVGEYTTLEGYFVDQTYLPQTQNQIANKYDSLFEVLYIELVKLNISLDATRGKKKKKYT